MIVLAILVTAAIVLCGAGLACIVLWAIEGEE